LAIYVIKSGYPNNYVSSHFPDLAGKKFEIINKMQPNTGALTSNFVYSFLFNYKYFSYIECVKPYSKVCKFSLPNHGIEICKNFVIQPLNASSFSSSNFVYIINCIKCKHIYIGESGRKVSDRLNEHLYSIDPLYLTYSSLFTL